LELTSEYNNFEQGTGIDFRSIGDNGLNTTYNVSYFENGNSGNLLRTNRMLTDSQDSQFKQLVPLKDTPYYKFYNHLYTGSKTLQTGTWDGIIPKGAFVNVEFLSTTLEKEIGFNFDCALIYSGHGTLDNLDTKIVKAYQPYNYYPILQKSKISDEAEISYTAYGTANDFTSALDIARASAYKQMYKNINKIIKLSVPEIVLLNRKYRKLKMYQQKLVTKQLQNTLPDTVYLGASYLQGETNY
jgi:hypothetical protein